MSKNRAKEYCDQLVNFYNLKRRAGHVVDIVTSAEYIQKYGRPWGPRIFPQEVEWLRSKECYKNAYLLAEKDPKRLRYVEGFANESEHAWCVNQAGEVVDPTPRDRRKTDYFGVEFELDALRRILAPGARGGGVFNCWTWKEIATALPGYNELAEEATRAREKSNRKDDSGSPPDGSSASHAGAPNKVAARTRTRGQRIGTTEAKLDGP